MGWKSILVEEGKEKVNIKREREGEWFKKRRVQKKKKEKVNEKEKEEGK